MFALPLSLLLSLAATVDIGDAVTCYYCSSGTDSACGDSFNGARIATCQGNFCSMTRTSSYGYVLTSRQCHSGSPGKYANRCFPHTSGTDLCYCDSSYCNKRSRSNWGNGSTQSVHNGISNPVLIIPVVSILAILRNVF
ncbi:hypothetical protein NP493_31g00021 [Ridgeia piscesae]|uniref:Protein quiver n=1 Tax=Ridgeia piscesae TaxID=27915 RepID=A0AAD9PD13_RIDPI|nr:hypothetical protein NP493_31g00021 [Ridgeia piscesae]